MQPITQFVLTVVPSTDNNVMNSVGKFAEKCGLTCQGVVLTPTEPQQTDGISWPMPFGDSTEANKGGQYAMILMRLNARYVRKFSYNFQTWNLIYQRNYNHSTGLFDRLVDTITLQFHQPNAVPFDSAYAYLDEFKKHFTIASGTQLPEEFANEMKLFYERRESSLNKLEDTIKDAANTFANYRKEAELAVLKEKQELIERERQLQQGYEQRVLKHDIEHQERTKALDERAANINDRENVHERRRLYDEIKKQIQAKVLKPELTMHTVGLRKLVWWLSGSMVFFLLIVFTVCFVINLRSDNLNWVAIGSQVTSGAGLIGVAVFCIRWQNNYYMLQANEEYRLKRMELDIERASWLVELALEWSNETDSPIPSELMERLGASLFSYKDAAGPDIHPLETLRTGLGGKNWHLTVEPGKVEAQSSAKPVSK